MLILILYFSHKALATGFRKICRMVLLKAGYSVKYCIYLIPEVRENQKYKTGTQGPQIGALATGHALPPSPGPWCHKAPSMGPPPHPGALGIPWESAPFLNPEVGSEKSGSVKIHRLTRAGGALRHPKHPLSARNEHGKAECHEDASPRRPTRKSLHHTGYCCRGRGGPNRKPIFFRISPGYI